MSYSTKPWDPTETSSKIEATSATETSEGESSKTSSWWPTWYPTKTSSKVEAASATEMREGESSKTPCPPTLCKSEEASKTPCTTTPCEGEKRTESLYPQESTKAEGYPTPTYTYPTQAPEASGYAKRTTSFQGRSLSIDEYQRTEQSRTFGRLDRENTILQKQVSCYHRSWHTTLDLLREAFEAALLIRSALDSYDTKVSVAKKEWLASWGIYRETPDGLKYPLPE